MFRKMNLQLFADGGEGGSGIQGGNAGTGNGSQGNAGAATFTFEQAEEIASARAQRAEQAALKSFFQQQGMSDDEIKQAIADYKANKEKSKPNVSAIEKERDEARKKLQQYENEKILLGPGMKVKAEDLDYVMFKVSALVTDKKDFKTAASEWLKENPRYKEGGTYRMNTGAAAGESTSGAGTGNEAINDLIRNAFGRK